MEDFFSKFQDAPSKDLLKITGNPLHYQEKAVEAAARILALREVTSDDLAQAKQEDEVQQKWLNREADIVNHLKGKTENFLTYLLRPSDELDVRKWVYIICIVTGVQYLFSTVSSVQQITFLVTCESCSFGFIESLYIIDLLLPVIIIVLLLKRNKWGWRLLTFSASVVIFSKLNMLSSGMRYISPYLPAIMPEIIISAGMLWFISKKAVMDYFGESKNNFIRAMLAGVLFTGAIMLYTVRLM